MKYKIKMQFIAFLFYSVQVDDQYSSKYVLLCELITKVFTFF